MTLVFAWKELFLKLAKEMASQQTSMSTAQAVHNHIEVIEKIDGDTEVTNDIEPPEPSGCFCCFCKGGKVRCKSQTLSQIVCCTERFRQ